MSGRSALWLLAMMSAIGCNSLRHQPIDLVDLYPRAEKRSSFDVTQAFSVSDTTISGVRRRTILAHAPARLSWAIKVPPGGMIEAWAALRPEAWGREGDGAVFRIGVAAAGKYTQLATSYVDPYHRPEDRRWVKLDATLSSFATQDVTLILSTDASPAGQGLNPYNDLCVWGDPRVVIK